MLRNLNSIPSNSPMVNIDGNEVGNGQGPTWNDTAEVCGQMEGDTGEETRNFTIWLDPLYQDLTSNS